MINKKSLLTTALFALLAISCGGSSHSLHVPGSPDDLSHVYDSVVGLVTVNHNGSIQGPWCTATFVSPRLLATAAHCVPAEITINVGSGTLHLPAPEGTSPVGQSVHFLTYQHYNNWIARRNTPMADAVVYNTAIVVQVDDENKHDVALLELAPDEEDSKDWLEMRDLVDDVLRPGEEAYSIGMPVNQTWILTSGIISRIEIRPNSSIDILHQVRIGPGSSGSALLDDEGKIVGINSGVWGGIGFGSILAQAKPISYIQTLIEVHKLDREINRLDRDFENSRSDDE